MNRKVVIIFSLVLLMTLVSVASVSASRPETNTFTQVSVLVGVDPGNEFMTGDVLHIKGSISEVYHYGGPWGNSIN